METALGSVGDLKVVKKMSMGYVLENGMETEDAFAKMQLESTRMETKSLESESNIKEHQKWCSSKT